MKNTVRGTEAPRIIMIRYLIFYVIVIVPINDVFKGAIKKNLCMYSALKYSARNNKRTAFITGDI